MNRKIPSLLVAASMLAFSAATMVQPALASSPYPSSWSWVKYDGNPVVKPTTCAAVGAPIRPAVVVESTLNYKMYFTTYPANPNPTIYLATTADGGKTWTCGNSGNPLLALGGEGAFDETRIIEPTVIKDNGTYRMWYSGRSAAAVYGIGYATSPNGVDWTKQGQVTLSPATAWDSAYIHDLSVVKVDSTHYHMWFEGTDMWPYYKIGHATSSDGLTWRQDPGPVLVGTAGAWDAVYVYNPSVVYDGSTFHMFYSGTNSGRWLTGHATSSNGTIWTKDANAILSPEPTGWERQDSLDYVAGVLDGTTWKVFYSAAGDGYQIGMATLTDQAQLQFVPMTSNMQVGNSAEVDIYLNDVTNLYGYQFQVNYDNTKVSAVGAFVDSWLSTASGKGFVAWNADCTTTPGVCKFSVAQQRPLDPLTGAGELAKITFTGLAPTTASIPVSLSFSNDILSDKDGNQIVHSTNAAYLQVYDTAILNGVVTLQGRSTPKTTGTVTLYESGGYFTPTSVDFNADTGAWSATVPAYASGTAYNIVAAHSLYLSNEEDGVAVALGGTYVQPLTKLLGGDANNDGHVYTGDITCIGGAFGGAPSTCGGTGSSDINADGTVNIQDLSIAGGNYDLYSPRPW